MQPQNEVNEFSNYLLISCSVPVGQHQVHVRHRAVEEDTSPKPRTSTRGLHNEGFWWQLYVFCIAFFPFSCLVRCSDNIMMLFLQQKNVTIDVLTQKQPEIFAVKAMGISLPHYSPCLQNFNFKSFVFPEIFALLIISHPHSQSATHLVSSVWHHRALAALRKMYSVDSWQLKYRSWFFHSLLAH